MVLSLRLITSAIRGVAPKRILVAVAAFVALLLLLGEQANSQAPPAKTKQSGPAKKPSKAKPSAPAKPERVAVPAAAELKVVQEKIQALYGPDLDKAKKPADKAALATTILKTATESADDPGAYYALLTLTRELALGGGNVQLALDATKLLVAKFEVDAQQETYTLLKKYTDTPDANVAGMLEAANTSFKLAEEAAARDDYAMALKFSSLAQAAATKSRSAPLLKQVAAMAKELTARETESAAIPAAKEKLAADPNDPAANLTLGRWHWFRKQDPAAAMPYLAKTVESPLKKAALAELEKPTTPDAQLALADQWWALSAVVKEELVKERLLVRAADWYQTGLLESKGFDKIKAERRLAEINKLVESFAPKPVISATQPAASGKLLPQSVKTSLGSELLYIPPGKFMMGSPKTEEGRNGDKENQVEVELSNGFYMGKFEVTQGEWKALMGTEPWKPYAFNLGNIKLVDNLPVVFVSQGMGANGQIRPNSAAEFCQKLSQRERKKYRLPTEAEWEYACRGGTTTAYSFPGGDANLDEYAWYSHGGNEKHTMHPVGLKKPNPFGLHDMHGNVEEWCSDGFNRKNPKLFGGLDPLGAAPDENEYRAVRGGSYSSMSLFCRSANRDEEKYTTSSVAIGFRLVLELDPKQAAAAAPAMAGPAKSAPSKEIKTGLGAELLYIPPGKFQMGSRFKHDGVEMDESQVDVEISRGFYLGKYEVTQGEWKALMGTEPWIREGKAYDAVKLGDDYPAVHIRHSIDSEGRVHPDSATAFLQKLSLKEGRAYRLPTEAEWEYACRAGTTSEYSFGDDATKLEEYAWWGGEWKRGNVKAARHARPVGKLLPNPWGLYDMHGNVAEWCSDPAADKLPGGRDPFGKSSNENRAVRGGSWYTEPLRMRSAARGRSALGNGNSNLGFRIALTAP